MHEMIVSKETIQNKINTVRSMQVMLDSDLADLYQVETKQLNRAVTRNMKKFPENFRFQVTKDEYDEILRCQFGTSSIKHDGRRYMPYVFTEQGVSMLGMTITIKKLDVSHDRFLIIDDEEIYHIGASLKDLGKKWFAFSKMDENSFGILERLR